MAGRRDVHATVQRDAEDGLPAVYDHVYSDGAYQLVSYTPKKQMKFTRNPVWKASADRLRRT